MACSLCIDPKRFLFREIPFYECHVHTSFSKGKNSIEELVGHAAALGCSIIAFTEHTEPWLFDTKDWFKAYVAQIRQCQEKFKGLIDITVGFEVPAVDFEGGLQIDSHMLENADFILGAAHRYPGLEDGVRVRDLSFDQAVDLEFKTLIALAENPIVDSIAHIGATCTKYAGKFPMKYIEQVIQHAGRCHTAIEINYVYHKSIIDHLISLCIKANAFITLGSNAYALEDLGRSFFMVKGEQEREVK